MSVATNRWLKMVFEDCVGIEQRKSADKKSATWEGDNGCVGRW